MRNVAQRMRLRAAGDDAATVIVDASSRLDVPQPGQPNYDQRVRETLMTYLGKQGNYLDRGITVRDLIASGIVTLPPGWTPGSGGGGVPPFTPGSDVGYKVDLTPPPDVTGFHATPGISVVFLETDNPTFTQGHGYFRTNIYGKTFRPGVDPPPTFADAEFIMSFSGEVGSWATQPAATLALWAKWETQDGVESINPVGGTNGVVVTTGQDVTAMVTAMTGPGKPFMIVTETTVLPDGSVVPPGTYTSDAYIHNGQITNAMIQNLAVNDAKIQTLSASKIKAGTIAVGEYIRSSGYVAGSAGWIINGNGGAEFSNVTVRGAVFASSGTFAGSLQAATGTFIGDVSGATGTFNGGVRGGSFTGYAWPPAGQSGYYLGPGGLLLGNANNGRYFQVESDGNIYMPGMSVVNGNATFSGGLSGASGTFSGTLTAAAVNAVNTINVAGNAITVPQATATTGVQNLNTVQWQSVLQIGVNSVGQGMNIVASCLAQLASNMGELQFRMLRDGAEVQYIYIGGTNGAACFMVMQFVDYPGAGGHTYDLQCYFNKGASSFQAYVQSRGIQVLECKR